MSRSAGPQTIPPQTYDYALLEAFASENDQENDQQVEDESVESAPIEPQAEVGKKASSGSNDEGSNSHTGDGGDQRDAENHCAAVHQANIDL